MAVEELYAGLDAVKRPLLASRTVAVLDVLGFKGLIESAPLPSLAQRYEAALEGSTHFLEAGDDSNEPLELRRAVVCDRFVFSDTIILVSIDDGEAAAEDVLFCAWRTCQFFIGAGMPLRGAVAFGEMHADRSRQVFLGKALTRAHALEQRQQWIGAAIDPSLVAEFPNLFPDDAENYMTGVVPPYKVPMKDGLHESLRTINWRAQFVVEKGIRSLFRVSDDASVSAKVANTLAYAGEMRTRGYAFRRPYFHRMAPLVITDSPRPEAVTHGDEL